MQELHERAEQQARQLSELDELNRKAWNARLYGVPELRENDEAWAKAQGKCSVSPPRRGRIWIFALLVLILGLFLPLGGGDWVWTAIIQYPLAIFLLILWWRKFISKPLEADIQSFVQAWRSYAISIGLRPSYESQLFQKTCHVCKYLTPYKQVNIEMIEVQGSTETGSVWMYDIVSGNVEGCFTEIFDLLRGGADEVSTVTFLVAVCPESTPYIRVEPQPLGRWQRFFGGAVKVNPEFDRSFRVYAGSAQDVDSILQPDVIGHLLLHREQQLYIEITSGLAVLCHKGFLYKSQLPYLMETASYFLRAILRYMGKEPDRITKSHPDVTDQVTTRDVGMSAILEKQECLVTPKKEDKLRPSRNIELHLPYDKVFELCISSLSSIKKCKIRYQDYTQGRIYAKSGTTMKSFGEIISFDIRRLDSNKTWVKISSRPAMSGTAGDWGKNRKNVGNIIGFLKERDSM